ncbi:hypothetical protein ACVW2B_002200 [Ewingella americana]
MSQVSSARPAVNAHTPQEERALLRRVAGSIGDWYGSRIL